MMTSGFASDWRRRRREATQMPPAVAMVEKATRDVLTEPDWAVNMDICDAVNSDLRQARDVIKAVKKRLMQKSPMVQFLALTLLEAMVKNCGDYVHLQIVECEVLDEMVKIAKKKDDLLVREKLLVLLDSWQEAFGGPQGIYPQYFWAYVEVKGSGVLFPPRSGDTSPIFTPPITSPAPRKAHQHHIKSSSSVRLEEAIALETRNFSSSELESMRRVMELLKDMLEAVNRHDCEALLDEIIIDLVKQCCSNQKKIRNLINSTRNEELLVQALALNDDLHNLIVNYNALATGQPVLSSDHESFSAHNQLSGELAKSTGRLEEEEDEDDGFTQLARRNANKNPHTTISAPSSKTGPAEPSASWTTTSEMVSVTSSSPTTSIPAATVVKEQDSVSFLGTLLTDPSSHPPNPAANSSTRISSIVDSYGSSALHSSPEIPPINTLALSPIPHSSYNQSEINSASYPFNPQPHPMDQGYFYTGYIAPWAQTSQQPPIYEVQSDLQGLSSYPPPPWETSPGREDDNFLSVPDNEYESVSSGNLHLENSFDLRDDEAFHSARPDMSTSANAPSGALPRFNDHVETHRVKATHDVSPSDHFGQSTDGEGELPRTTFG